MSGRWYDNRSGVPICKCGRYAKRSDETNFNGNYCDHCKTFFMADDFDINHPYWKAYDTYLNKHILMSFKTFKAFKKENKSILLWLAVLLYEM